MYLFRPVILIFSYNTTISSVFFVNEDDETFLIIVDETKTKTKIKTRDENEIEIYGILVLTTLTRISEAKFGK